MKQELAKERGLRAIIFANGELKPPVQTEKADIIIAADGGAKHCLELGIQPNYVIGDFDSLEAETLAALKAKGAELIEFPAKKDFTDLELAIQHAASLKPRDILIYGALGARWDQTIANILLAGAYPHLNIHLLDQKQEIRYLVPGERLVVRGHSGDTVSLIPIGGSARGITTQNLEYPLIGETLHVGSTRGISNTLLEDWGAVELEEGMLLCIVIRN